MKCKSCDTEITSKGTKPKKFCSDACRMAYKRTSKRTEVETNTANEQTLLQPSPLEAVEDFTTGEIVAVVCHCRHCQNVRANGNKHFLNHGAYKPVSKLGKGELNRVSIPGDADYTLIKGE